MSDHCAPPGVRPTIVVVEDDSDLLHSLQFSLELEGWAVAPYASAEALLSAGPLSNRACLVIDHLLPGSSGLDLLSELRKRGVLLPAIVITTHPGAQLRARATAAGASIVEKPLLNASLIQAIHQALPGSVP